MFHLPGMLGTLTNLIVVIIGFGLIVFVHELGHFVAAKWAGIRVLAFSMGIGPVVCSYRKGIGFRRGSSEREYIESLRAGGKDAGPISPTEYRLSLLPLGGYVKMLGQEDLNPGAVSSAPDSYQNRPVPKRLVVISAGVVMNVLTAAALFVIVFMVGLVSLPARVGTIVPGSPAELATPVGRADLGAGLRHGDLITEINGSRIYGFRDIASSVAMAPKSAPTRLVIERAGVEGAVVFEVTPRKGEGSGLLELGVGPMLSTTVVSDIPPAQWASVHAVLGGADLQQGDELLAVNGQPVDGPDAILDAVSGSGGEPCVLLLSRAGEEVAVTLEPIRDVQHREVELDGSSLAVDHVLGMPGVLCVDPNAPPESTAQGLMPGDVFVRIGSVMYPSMPRGIETVRSLRGMDTQVEVLRDGQVRTLDVRVSQKGTIGFIPSSTIGASNIVGTPLDSGDPGLITRPGTRILSINGTEIRTLRDVAPAIIDATAAGYGDAQQETFEIPVELELPLPTQPDGSAPIVRETWTLSREQIAPIHELGWSISGGQAIRAIFRPVTVVDKSPNPMAAVARGVHESKRVMTMAYVTFLRMYQGSVQLKQLNGPVGIAHLGTQIADQGFVWLLFFMGLISINLAVVNFLPLPIVDGGQFLMLLYEWARGKPLPIAVQNAVTLAGLILIGGLFLYITFNDISRIFGGI